MSFRLYELKCLENIEYVDWNMIITSKNNLICIGIHDIDCIDSNLIMKMLIRYHGYI